MEQKKTLWIVAAAGIFLLVVVGAALILYSPSLHKSSGLQAGFDPTSGWISSTQTGATPVPENSISFTNETPSSEETQPLNPLPSSPFAMADQEKAPLPASSSEGLLHADKLTVISDNATVYSNGTTTIDLNTLKSSNSSNVTAKNEMTENQINTKKAYAKESSESSYKVAESSSSSSADYYAPVSTAKTSVAKSAVKAAPAKKSTSVAKAAPKSTKAETAKKVASSAKKAQDSFWVQAAAYTSKRNADEARTTLESNKIPSEVFTFTDSKGKTFYRVRVGPYITKSEAEYWQTRIGMIDKFASAKSVIVNTAIN
ncbi:MAG: SPOR domain-containing protein [Treponema sp.]|nr:SPOR domain-containing protein [Treponema sp.]